MRASAGAFPFIVPALRRDRRISSISLGVARWREWSQRHERRQQFTERNINYFAKYVDDDELRLVQNRHGVHLCPSEAEGFGHTLVEAMSCGAVVITTDGPPMNEMVTPDRGALVRYGRTGRQRPGPIISWMWMWTRSRSPLPG